MRRRSLFRPRFRDAIEWIDIELDATASEMAEKIAASPAVSVKMARRVIARLARPQLQASMGDELIYQTFINKSDDYAEMRAARAEERAPVYRGS